MLRPAEHCGVVSALLINKDRKVSLESERVSSIRATYSGFEGDAHGGLTRASCSRVKLQYRPGTEIRNTRQISIVSVEELHQIAGRMEIPSIEPEWLGANLLISGIPFLTLLPPSTRLIFSSGVSIVVDMENGPCKFPGEVIDRRYPGRGRRFAKSAQQLRGVTGWVERQGLITEGDRVTPHFPVQPAYPAVT